MNGLNGLVNGFNGAVPSATPPSEQQQQPATLSLALKALVRAALNQRRPSAELIDATNEVLVLTKHPCARKRPYRRRHAQSQAQNGDGAHPGTLPEAGAALNGERA